MAYPSGIFDREYNFGSTRSRRERVARIDALASLLDTAFILPGTNVRFGLDAIIGLVPGIGDAITTAMSLYIVHEARQLGAPRHVILRMLGQDAGRYCRRSSGRRRRVRRFVEGQTDATCGCCRTGWTAKAVTELCTQTPAAKPTIDYEHRDTLKPAQEA